MSSTSPRSRSSTRWPCRAGPAGRGRRTAPGSASRRGSTRRPAWTWRSSPRTGSWTTRRRPTPSRAPDHWSATFSAMARWAIRSRPGSRIDDDCFEWEHGLVDADLVLCRLHRQRQRRRPGRALRRWTGTEIDQAEVGAFTGYGAFAARPDHRLFLWDPQSHTLMSYDLQTGSTQHASRCPDTAVIEGPLDIAVGDRPRRSGRGSPRRRRPRSCSSRRWSSARTARGCMRSASRRPPPSSAARPASSPSTSAATRSPCVGHWPPERGLRLARR